MPFILMRILIRTILACAVTPVITLGVIIVSGIVLILLSIGLFVVVVILVLTIVYIATLYAAGHSLTDSANIMARKANNL